MSALWTRLTRVLTHSTEELDDADLQSESLRRGTTAIAALPDRGIADVAGVVKSITIPPRGQVPSLSADLYDGTGTIGLVWVGRRVIRGIEPGVRMRVRGRVSQRRNVPTIYNPAYDIIARDVDED